MAAIGLTTNLLADAVPPMSKFTTEFTHDEGLVGGTQYFYRIQALADTNSDWSTDGNPDADTASAKTLGDVPNQVGTVQDPVTAVAIVGKITVSWDKLTGDATGGSAILGYDVQKWDNTRQQWADEASLGDVATYDDTDVAGGATHFYRVRARNSEGPGDWSAPVAQVNWWFHLLSQAYPP